MDEQVFNNIVNGWKADPIFDLVSVIEVDGTPEQIAEARQIEDVVRQIARQRNTFADLIGKPDPTLWYMTIQDALDDEVGATWKGFVHFFPDSANNAVRMSIPVGQEEQRNNAACAELQRLTEITLTKLPNLTADVSGTAPGGVEINPNYREYRVLFRRLYTEAELTRGDLFRFEICDDVHDPRQHAEMERRVSAQMQHGWKFADMRGHRDSMIVALVRSMGDRLL